ncbi:MAG: CocE/NonD family hydrolase C-terminal non-catalytic domain-containing protein, partial [Acetobacteraceae bacterium]
EFPAPLQPGQRFRVRMELNDIAFRFPEGHRVRLALSTSYWPMVWPAAEPVTLTVLSGAIELPARSSRSEDEALLPMPVAETAPPAARTILTGGHSRRESGRDVVTGERFYRSIEEPSLTRIDAIAIELGNAATHEFRIRDDDPLSARAETTRTQSVRRGEWQVRTETWTRLTASRDAFRVEARVDAYEGDRRVCRREWDESIPRDQV